MRGLAEHIFHFAYKFGRFGVRNDEEIAVLCNYFHLLELNDFMAEGLTVVPTATFSFSSKETLNKAMVSNFKDC